MNRGSVRSECLQDMQKATSRVAGLHILGGLFVVQTNVSSVSIKLSNGADVTTESCCSHA